MKIASDMSLTAEERALQMDALLKDEEMRIYEVEKQLARLRETQVGHSTEMLASLNLQLRVAVTLK